MAGERIYLAFSLGILSICTRILAFNLDTKVPIVKEGVADSYFGFSVAQHLITNEGTGLVESYVIVGAPRDNVTDPNVIPQVRSIVRPGQVYSCPLSSYKDDCAALDIDREAPGGDEDKNDQWLGVSVASQGTPDGMAIACGHRYKEFGQTYRWGYGMCLSLYNALDEGQFWNPCKGMSTADGHKEYGFCQSGSSVALDPNGDVLFGVPGPYVWRGAVVKNRIVVSLEDFQQAYWSPVETLKESETGPEPATEYYSYLGMTSKFGRDIHNRTLYLGGAPRSKDLGQVLMFTQDTTNARLQIDEKHYITGEQFGSNFGHDFAMLDLNLDGKQDLVVGAPFYFEPRVGGAIYVYISGEEGVTKDTVPIKIASRKMTQKECAELNCENARFGFSVARIGDVDRDGYEDVAVGAPYEGDGAVYIFRGAEHGIVKEYSQRIYAGDLLLARPPLNTFGYSLSGGIDMDKNEYPDLVVGAYNSSKVVILRSRPVINIKAVVMSMPDKIRPDVKQCPSTGQPYNCFEIRVCFAFTAEPRDRFTERIDIDYQLEAEKFLGQKISRVYFKETDNHILNKPMKLNEQTSPTYKCREHLVYINKNNKDFLNAIPFQLTYQLRDVAPPVMQQGMPLPDINEYPVLNEKAAKQVYLANFEKNCGTDDICRSDLSVSGRFELDINREGDYVLKVGQKEELELMVDIKNSREDAHEASLAIDLPDNVDYRGVDGSGRDFTCVPTGQQIICQIGNPFKQGAEARFTVRLRPQRIHATMEKLKFTLRVNTTSEEVYPVDDISELSVRVIVETDLLVRGYGLPAEVEYSGVIKGESAIQFEDEIGLGITHTYEVKNTGFGTVANSTLHISWPYELENGYPQGKHLLYLMEQPQVDPPAKCTLNPELVNPLKIRRLSSTPEVAYNTPGAAPSNVTFGSHDVSSRWRRDTGVQHMTPETIIDATSGKELKVVTLDCVNGRAKCFTFVCVIGQLPTGGISSIAVKMRARLWNSTFLSEFRDVDQVRIYSRAEVKIDPRLNVQQLSTANDVFMALTIARPALVAQKPKEVPLWVIILAACAGVLLLIIIIILLWKCGFFKRTTPDEMKKHQANLEKKNKKNKHGSTSKNYNYNYD